MDKKQWESHAKACLDSEQNKSSYAKAHKLTYHRLLYWTRKLNKQQECDFLPVKIKHTAPSSMGALGVVEFPNGIRLIIQSPELLSHLPTLLAAES